MRNENHIYDDLYAFFSFCSQLVLRKWSELIPGGEFRCFVKENKLIGKTSQSFFGLCPQTFWKES